MKSKMIVFIFCEEEKEREKLEKMEQIRLTQREELVKHSDSQ